MIFIKNLKVSKKLWLIVAPAMIMLVILLVLFVNRSISIGQESKKVLYDELYVSSAEIINADRDFYQALLDEKEIVLSTTITKEEKDKLIADYNENVGQIEERMGGALDNIKNNNELYSSFTEDTNNITFEQLYQDFDKEFTTWKTEYDISTGTGDLEARQASFDNAREDINSMTELLDKYAQFKSKEIQNETLNSIKISVLTISIFIIVMFLLSVMIVRYLRINIKEITNDMDKLANNNLGFEPHIVNSKDELGILSISIRAMIDALRGIISLLNSSSNELENTSLTMKVNANEVTTSINEIANAIGEIAESAGTQAADTEMVSKEINVLGDVINRNTNSTNQLSSASTQIQEVTNEGISVINHLLEITTENTQAFNKIFDTINKTSDSAVKIGEVSNIIAGIAEQTNLLALNAAIEAARAGEAGKGFSVVADEIRKLAEQSTSSTSQIDHMLKELKENIQSANIISDLVKDAVKLQAESVDETKNKYLIIVDIIEIINKEIIALSNVSKELEKSRSEVVGVVSSLTAIAEENAASTEQTSATTEEVLATMITISELGEDVNRLSMELKELILAFEL